MMLGFLVPLPRAENLHSRRRHATVVCMHARNTAKTANISVSNSSRAQTPPVVFVLGGPGSGKGTQCEKLQNDFDFVQVCVGDLLRREAAGESLTGKKIANIMQSGEIVPGEVTMALLKVELAKFRGSCDCVLIDGFPRAMDQARAFEDIITACEFVLYFNCDESVMIKRLTKRAETSGRADDNGEVVKRRLRTFKEKTVPVIEHYRQRGLLQEVHSAVGTPDEVYERTKHVFTTMFSPS